MLAYMSFDQPIFYFNKTLASSLQGNRLVTSIIYMELKTVVPTCRFVVCEPVL